MKTLPVGWTTAKLGDIAGKGQYGWTTKAAGAGSVQFLRTTDITKRSIDWHTVPWCEEEPADVAKYRLAPGDIVISRAGSVGFSKLLADVPGLVVFASYLIRFKPSDVLDARYLAAYLRSDSYWAAIASASAGIAVSNVNASSLAELEVPIAPRAEQRRIADKLDNVLARVDSVNDRLARVAPLLKRFRQSVLAAATSGKLTEDWRRLHQQPPVADLALQGICQIGRVITYGVVKLGDEVAGGTPCLRTSNVRWLRFELDGMKSIRPSLSAEYGRTILQGGEVLVNVRGTLGGVAVAAPEMKGWNVSREVAVVPVDLQKADPRFVALCVGSEEGQRWLTGVAKGVAYTGINIEDLRSLPLKLPTLLEQAEIVRRVELLFAYAARLETRLQAAQTAAERLTPALLAKAFRGELVPQDPNDEPASELLKRLTAQRPPARPRGRKPAARTSE
ncbi:MAG: restriction endonuclease subunit S [Roseateles depolymerans]|uniref:Restriction endonuclease subunit S n=1 Tax=Roseateles depolymerans TaxID=76731 RepID=A0A2W5DLY6_9BURK|nr:MAG: restriction endonuclease subunit S [Roseateles depolymerans]